MIDSPCSLPISVVIPVLNEVQCLPETLEALGQLNPKPLEIIFVDAGSTDGSMNLLSSWIGQAHLANTQVYLFDCPGALPGAARNAGLEKASQIWIAFLDVGVTPANHWLGALWNCQQRTCAKAVYAACRFTADSALGVMLCAATYGVNRSRPTLPGSLFTSVLFDQIGKFDGRLRAGEDLLWKQRLRAAAVSIVDCTSAVVVYKHFSSSVWKALKKCFAYQKSISENGQIGKLHGMAAVCFAALIGAMCIDVRLALLLGLAYFLARGIIDPMLRSRCIKWWSSAWQVLAFPFLVALLDASSLLGSVYGRLLYACHVLKRESTKVHPLL